jgi:predicted cobalt transporter CbtA
MKGFRNVANYSKKDLDPGAAAAIVLAAIALFVAVFLFFGNKYGATEYPQMTQNSAAVPAPGNEVPAAPKPAPSEAPANL